MSSRQPSSRSLSPLYLGVRTLTPESALYYGIGTLTPLSSLYSGLNEPPPSTAVRRGGGCAHNGW